MQVDKDKEVCSGCNSWQLPEGEEKSTCDVGMCTNTESPKFDQPMMFADGCGKWKPITIVAAPATPIQ